VYRFSFIHYFFTSVIVHTHTHTHTGALEPVAWLPCYALCGLHWAKTGSGFSFVRLAVAHALSKARQPRNSFELFSNQNRIIKKSDGVSVCAKKKINKKSFECFGAFIMELSQSNRCLCRFIIFLFFYLRK